MVTIRSLPRRLVVWERGEAGCPLPIFPSRSRCCLPSIRFLRASASRGCLEDRQSHWTERALRLNFYSMEESDTSVTLEQEKPSGLISVEEAAERIGLDPFTVYRFIQRDRLSPILDNEGVFLVSEEEANTVPNRKKE